VIIGTSLFWITLAMFMAWSFAGCEPPFLIGSLALLCQGFTVLTSSQESRDIGLTRTTTLLVLSGAGVLILIPMLVLLLEGFPAMEFVTAPFFVLTATLLIPAFYFISMRTKYGAGMVLACSAVLLFVGALAATRRTVTSPEADSIAYFENVDDREAYWLVDANTHGKWLDQFKSRAMPPHYQATFLPDWFKRQLPWHGKNIAYASSAAGTAIVSTLTMDRTAQAGVNHVTLRIAPNPQANEVWIHIAPSERQYEAWEFERRLPGTAVRFCCDSELPRSGDSITGQTFVLVGVAENTFAVTFQSHDPTPPQVEIVNQVYQLPTAMFIPRDNQYIPQRSVGDRSFYLQKMQKQSW
jgi:hypothetical protein